LKELIKELRLTVSLEEYARHLGYVPDPSEGKGKTITYQKLGKGKGEVTDKVIIQTGKHSRTGQDLYFNRKGYTEDKGDVVQFAKNRLSGGLTLRTSPADTLEAVERLMAYRGLSVEDTKGKEKVGEGTAVVPQVHEKMEERPPFKIQEYHLEKLSDFRYLESRHIPRSVIEAPQFRNRIFSGNAKKVLETYPDLKNTIFPLSRFEGLKEKIVGLVLRNTPGENFGGKIMAAGSDHASGIWLSEVPEGCNRVVFTESEIDALSYYTLHPKASEKAVFISSSGSLGQGQLATIKLLLERVGAEAKKEKRAAPEIVLANDHDRQGCIQDLKLLSYWINTGGLKLGIAWAIEHEVEKIAGKEDTLRVSIRPLSENNKIQQLGDLVTLAGAFKKEVIPRGEVEGKNDSKTDTKGFKTSFRFPLEKGLDSIIAFTEGLVKLAGLKGRIQIDKSAGKDWNEDLASGVKNEVLEEGSRITKGKEKINRGGLSLRIYRHEDPERKKTHPK